MAITPAISQTPTVENWMRSQQLTEAIALQPEVYPELTKRYGKQDYSVSGLTAKLGGESIINNMAFRHAEENFLHEVLQFNTYAGGDNSTTLTVAAAYDYTFPNPAPASPYVSTNTTTAILPMPNQVIMFPNRQKAIVTAVNAGASTITVYIQGAGTLPAIATTDVIVILGNQTPENSKFNGSRDTQWIWYENNMANGNGTYSISGNAKSEKTWIKHKGTDKWFVPANMNEMMRLKNEREMLHIVNDFTTNLTYANATTTLLDGTTQSNATNISYQGMQPWLTAYSNQFGYNNVSFLNEQLWENFVTLTLVPNYGGLNYALYSSVQVINYNASWIRSEMKNGAWEYGSENGGKNWTNFTKNDFTISGRTIGQVPYDLLDATKLLGAIPYFKSYAIGIPLDTSEHTVGGWDNMSVTKEMPQFVVHYQEDRKWYELMVGGAPPAANQLVDSVTIGYQWTTGIEMFRPNAWFQVFNLGL